MDVQARPLGSLLAEIKNPSPQFSHHSGKGFTYTKYTEVFRKDRGTSAVSNVQPMTRGLRLPSLYRFPAGFLTYRSLHAVAFPRSKFAAQINRSKFAAQINRSKFATQINRSKFATRINFAVAVFSTQTTRSLLTVTSSYRTSTCFPFTRYPRKENFGIAAPITVFSCQLS